jgi:hypothetical protein
MGYSEAVAVKIYLDTNVYKFSATELPRLRVEMKEVNWGGRTFTMPLHTPVVINPNDRLDEDISITPHGPLSNLRCVMSAFCMAALRTRSRRNTLS